MDILACGLLFGTSVYSLVRDHVKRQHYQEEIENGKNVFAERSVQGFLKSSGTEDTKQVVVPVNSTVGHLVTVENHPISFFTTTSKRKGYTKTYDIKGPYGLPKYQKESYWDTTHQTHIATNLQLNLEEINLSNTCKIFYTNNKVIYSNKKGTCTEMYIPEKGYVVALKSPITGLVEAIGDMDKVKEHFEYNHYGISTGNTVFWRLSGIAGGVGMAVLLVERLFRKQ